MLPLSSPSSPCRLPAAALGATPIQDWLFAGAQAGAGQGGVLLAGWVYFEGDWLELERGEARRGVFGVS